MAVCCVLRGGKRCVWSGEAFLCVLLAVRVLLPSLVGVISSGNSLMVSFWRFELFFLWGHFQCILKCSSKEEDLWRWGSVVLLETRLVGMRVKDFWFHSILLKVKSNNLSLQSLKVVKTDRRQIKARKVQIEAADARISLTWYRSKIKNTRSYISHNEN